MNFGQPLWIIIGACCCIGLFFLILHMQKKRMATLEHFAAKNLISSLTRNVSKRKRKIKIILFIAALFTCFLALARPQYGHHWIDVKRKGIDILFAIDTSTSMLAEDIRPNRLERSKFAILDFISQLEGDRVGLMPFAGSAYLMCPLTIDYSAFEQSLQAIDTKIIPNPGTNIAEAIRHAENVLQNDANYKLLIVITDGENLQGDAVQAAKEAAEKGMTIFTVGVGTAAGELIPTNIDGKQGFVKDETGKFVTSKLDEIALNQIADITNGLYVPLGNKGQGLETIYQQKLALIPKEELAEKRHKIPIERFQWALAVTLFLLILEYLINSRKTAPFSFKITNITRKIGKNKLTLLGILASSLLFRPMVLHASPGEEAYREGDYLTASEYYLKAIEKEPENTTLHFNYGAVAYKNNLFDDAVTSFNKALQSNDLLLQEKAYYNRGNAQYQKGVESLQADPQKTMKNWQDALTSYSSALKLQPDSRDAQHNHELVQKKLEELKKQEQQKKQDNQDDQKDQEDQEGQKDQEGQENTSNSEGQQEKDQGDEANPQSDSPDEAGENEIPQEQQQTQEEEASAQNSQENEAQDQDTSENNQIVPGKLSKEEAEQLLNELKSEEGNLNFIPKGSRNPDNDSGRNW